MGRLKTPDRFLGSASKGPFLMPEQVALSQLFGDRSAVHRNEWPFAAIAQFVNEPGYLFLCQCQFHLG
jgi:hypothetical protein